MKRFSIILFVTILILLTPVISGAECRIMIDGEELICVDSNENEVVPFVHEGTTYVPVRAIAQAFDTTVSWDQETKTVHLGETGGEAELNEQINIFCDGKEYICTDVNGVRVFPILREGTTYLPIRSIGALFGKKIYWDNLTQTALLTTPPAESTIEYLKESISNTASSEGINVMLTVEAQASSNGAVFSKKEGKSEEKYAPNGFTLSTILPDNYTDNISYSGGGDYFIAVPSTRFISDQRLQETLSSQQTPTEYSSLYIYLSSKGGYLTDIKINFSGKVSYSGITLDQLFEIKAQLTYPEGFTFPIIPYPDKTYAENEKPVSAASGENSDATLIEKLIKSYVDYLTGAQAKKVFSLVNEDDYKASLAHKSSSQINMEMNNINKQLTKLYSDSDGGFTLDDLVYIETNTLIYPCEKAARATLGINHTDGDDTYITEVIITLIKRDSKWYLDISSAMDLYK